MSLINFYNLSILVNIFKLRPETSVDKDRVHQSDKWKHWLGIFRIFFFIKTDNYLVYYITWINHRKFYDVLLTIKRRNAEKQPLRSALGRSRFTQPSIHKFSIDFCFNTKWNVVKLSVMNLCDTINKIHATFDENIISDMPNQRFH
jgi:hypothetical protein